MVNDKHNSPKTAWAQREHLTTEFQALSNRLDVLCAGLSSEQVLRRPDASTWSICECIEHLNITERRFIPLLKAAIKTARELPAHEEAQAYHVSMLEKGALWFLEPPYRLKIKTPQEFVPPATLNPTQVKGEFAALHGVVLELLKGTARVPLDRVKIESPFEKYVKYSAWAAFRMIAVHDRRHLWQAEQIKDRLKQA